MTYGDVIERCDELVPNDLGAEYKLELLFEFECDIMLRVFMLAQDEVDLLSAPSEDTVLQVKMPHSKIYRLWLCAMLHKANGDYDDAANVTADFDIAFSEFVQWYGRTVAPGRGQAEYKGYYLSAYALAKLNGFEGTVVEWLVSLIGPPGATYEITEEDYAAIAAFCAEHYDAAIVAVNKSLAKLNGFTISAVAGDGAGCTVAESEDGIAVKLTVPKGDKGDAFKFEDFTEEQLSKLKGVGVKSLAIDFDGNLKITLTDDSVHDLGKIPAYVPKRGTDYWTQEDIAEIKSYVDDAILGGAW